MYSLVNIHIYDSANHISADIIASFLGLSPYLDPAFKPIKNAFACTTSFLEEGHLSTG